MGYMKAEEILPIEIIELIQQYVDGTNIYIPRKQENRQEWGANTPYRGEMQNRNKLIYEEFVSGVTIGDFGKESLLIREEHTADYQTRKVIKCELEMAHTFL